MTIDNAIANHSRLLVHMMDDPQNTDGLASVHRLAFVMRDRDVVIDLSFIEEELSDQHRNTLSATQGGGNRGTLD